MTDKRKENYKSKQIIKPILLDNLLVNVENPRYEPMNNQNDAISAMAEEQGSKLANLAEDIVNNGLNPSEIPIVTPLDNSDKYVVLEGNRRVAALKILRSSSILSKLQISTRLISRYKSLQDNSNTIIPSEIYCSILENEDAQHWLLYKSV